MAGYTLAAAAARGWHAQGVDVNPEVDLIGSPRGSKRDAEGCAYEPRCSCVDGAR